MSKLRGVNLGGWLVLERWMTPSLFAGTEAVDEYTFMQIENAKVKIEQHRQSFITEKDFKWIAQHGLNAVRIPVGYWVFDGDGPFLPCISYLDWAIQMAEKYQLKVLIDLHATKGSQNGKDHSGKIGEATWYRQKTYRQETIEVLERLASRYKASPNVWGIELLNEPKLDLWKFFILRRFYKNAYFQLTKVARPGTHIVFSDGFVPRLFSGVIKPKKSYPVVMDIHWYQFGFTKLERYFTTLQKRPKFLRRMMQKQPVIIGEWSGVLSHTTLQGISNDDRARFQEEHITMQRAAYESAAGWFYWTYKTEDPGIWNFRSLVTDGKIVLK